MARSIALGIMIGATLSGGFGQAIGGAKTKLTTLGAEIKSLGAQRGLIERFEKDQAALEQSRAQLIATNKEIVRLKKSLASGPPTKAMAKAMVDAKQKAEKLSRAIEKQRDDLRNSDAALRKAGLSVKDLGGQYNRLGSTLDRTRAKYDRLDRVMGKKSAAAARLGELKGQILGLAGALYGAGKIFGDAMDFEHEMRLFGNIADLGNDQLGKMRLQLKAIATDTNQEPGRLLQGLSTLSAKGMDPSRSIGSMNAIGRAATASGAQVNDLAVTTFSMIDGLKLAEKDLPLGLDMLAAAGKRGSFELRDMAQYFPMLTAQAKSLGLVGTEGVATLGSALQIAMKGAADPGTAANNLQNFLAKITSPETVKRFADKGVDLKQAMADAIASGQNPFEQMVVLIRELTDGDKFKIGELFGDMQVINFLNPMLQNLDEYQRIKKAAFEGKGTNDKDFENMVKTGKEQIGAFKIAVSGLGSAFAVTLLPAVTAVVRPLTSVVARAGDLIERFPWVGRLVGGLGAGLGVFVGGLVAVTAATWLWNAALLANPIGLTIAAIGGAAALIITFWEPIKDFFAGLWDWLKNIFKEGVGYLFKIWEVSPLGLMFKAGQKLYSLGAGLREKMFGKSEDASVTDKAANSRPAIDAGLLAPRQTAVSSATVNAPITINTHPGMDEKAVAEQVDKKLREREAAARARSRGALYD